MLILRSSIVTILQSYNLILVLNLRIESSAYLLPLFSSSLLFVDLYVVFVGECACLMVAAMFTICCIILKGSIKKFSGLLQKEGIDNEMYVFFVLYL